MDLELIHIEKLVPGGQGLGTLASGQKVFVWNVLPGEEVRVRVIKKKRSYAEAIAEEVRHPSPARIEPREPEVYLGSSPWQMMDFEAENAYKAELAHESMHQEGVQLPEHVPLSAVTAGPEWHYRNKMEYSFWGDDNGLHLALHQRGSKGKQIVDGSALAMPAIDAAARAVVAQLQGTRAGDLKTLILRCSAAGQVAAALFIKGHEAPALTLPAELQGLRVYHSNPKSPASVPTELLLELGNSELTDTLLAQQFTYDVDSFWQVNLPIFERALTDIRQHLAAPRVVDLYAGAGSIGLSVAGQAVTLVELDTATAAMAAVNAAASTLETEVIQTSAEAALEHIVSDLPLTLDPPRAGLHLRVVQRILEVRPPRIAYLSCNPSTQARDLKLLSEAYKITHFQVYNFFPQTPHIETLAVLELC